MHKNKMVLLKTMNHYFKASPKSVDDSRWLVADGDSFLPNCIQETLAEIPVSGYDTFLSICGIETPKSLFQCSFASSESLHFALLPGSLMTWLSWLILLTWAGENRWQLWCRQGTKQSDMATAQVFSLYECITSITVNLPRIWQIVTFIKLLITHPTI